MTQALLELHATRVPDAWLDYNGHMNDGAYAIAFSHATDRLMEHIGVDGDYRAQTGLTIYTLENHIRYLREAGGGDAVNITTQLLEHEDRKSTRLNSSHVSISYAVFCLKKKKCKDREYQWRRKVRI